mmetsp:Transcript_15286/g.35805  ORF Transcript_15286/g.35805 Transcript_15286/m.35805 type:complete len:226 (-) Transcript_15286:557-1234(-)
MAGSGGDGTPCSWGVRDNPPLLGVSVPIDSSLCGDVILSSSRWTPLACLMTGVGASFSGMDRLCLLCGCMGPGLERRSWAGSSEVSSFLRFLSGDSWINSGAGTCEAPRTRISGSPAGMTIFSCTGRLARLAVTTFLASPPASLPGSNASPGRRLSNLYHFLSSVVMSQAAEAFARPTVVHTKLRGPCSAFLYLYVSALAHMWYRGRSFSNSSRTAGLANFCCTT